MSNYIKYKELVAFHPGYYIQEILEDTGLTQEDFAKRLNTTPKNLSLLVRGRQRLSVEMAMKLSRVMKTSLSYWLNIQSAYDVVIAQIDADKELGKEIDVLKTMGYKYFVENFNLPILPRKLPEQVEYVREFLRVATLTVFCKRDMAVSFRSASGAINEGNIIKANAMVQIATNEALDESVCEFNKKRFEKSIEFALSQTTNHSDFYGLIKEEFAKAGVVFVVLPNLGGSKISGATKKIGSNVMLMVNDRRLYADSFWFTLMHEIGHIVNDDYGISFEGEKGDKEDIANSYAAEKLILPEAYSAFVKKNKFTLSSITEFAKSINRDPGIVLGRLQNDGYVRHDDNTMKRLKCKYKVSNY